MHIKPFHIFIVVLFILVGFFVIPVAASQVMWYQKYGREFEDADEGAQSLVETTDGSYAFAGYLQWGWNISHDFWLVKIDFNGNMIWNKTYGGSDPEFANSLIETSDGGFALTGITGYYDANDFWLVKTDSRGIMEWNQTYGGPRDEQAHSLVETSDGGFAIAGYTWSFGAGRSDFWLVKTDSQGNMEWNQTYRGTDNERAHSLIETADGGFALAGFTGGFAFPNDFLLVKTDVNGNMEWNQTYGGEDYETAYSLVTTSDGGFALGGETKSDVEGPAYEPSDFLLFKTDSHGNMEWNQKYGERTSHERAHSLVMTSDGGYALVGDIKFDQFIGRFGSVGYDFSDSWLVIARAHIDFKSPDAQSLIKEAKIEFNTGYFLAKQGKWQNAVTHLQNVSSLIDQAVEKEQSHQELQTQSGNLIMVAVVMAVLVISGLVVYVLKKTKGNKNLKENKN